MSTTESERLAQAMAIARRTLSAPTVQPDRTILISREVLSRLVSRITELEYALNCISSECARVNP